ncbi:MAG: hypothetical protein ACREBR_02730, partial [bacterium]
QERSHNRHSQEFKIRNHHTRRQTQTSTTTTNEEVPKTNQEASRKRTLKNHNYPVNNRGLINMPRGQWILLSDDDKDFVREYNADVRNSSSLRPKRTKTLKTLTLSTQSLGQQPTQPSRKDVQFNLQDLEHDSQEE